MKIKITFLGLAFLLLACSGSDENPAVPEPTPAENTAPSIPSLSFPDNNYVCLENPINFQWSASTDEQGDAITYQLQIATNAGFTNDISDYSTSNTNIEISLDFGQLFFWRIKAVDSQNLSGEFSEAYNFITEGEPYANHLPFAPGVEWPEMYSEQSEAVIELSWYAEDADQDDLVFDVFLGTNSSNLEQIATDVTDSFLNIDISSPDTYYWQVVVKDGRGGITFGQTWNFTKI